MPDENEFHYEPVRGLPEKPPAGETILWQGRPQVWALARESMMLSWVVGYFVLLAVWRVGASTADVGFTTALPFAVPFLVSGLLVGSVILGIAWILARTTVYTITTARVAMRIGAALTVTLNLPFNRITRADLDLRKSGTGTIALSTEGAAKLSYLVLWPHVRPWRMKQPEPALRCIPEAQRVAEILAEAAETRVSQPTISQQVPSGAVAAE
ncbi:MAG: PH domain-containing protein [Rhodobacteraceae bacterium]|nr:PH domain-containing protein [Paracoccaceae bacterium]